MKSSSILLILKTRYAPQMERRNEAPEDDNGASPRTLQCIRSRNVPLPTTPNDWFNRLPSSALRPMLRDNGLDRN